MKEKKVLEMYDGKVWGHKVSQYGLEHKKLDYRTLAEIVGDMILCNDIVKLMYGASIDGECVWADIENGSEYDEDYEDGDVPIDFYQYYIINGHGVEFLKEYTDETIWYIPQLDIYVWGITHFGTSWDYVLTDIDIVEMTISE